MRLDELDTTPPITLVSRPGVKWPRYRIQLEKGLDWKQAYDQSVRALQTQERQILTISQFKYDESTGIVDTRVRRENF